MKEKMRALKNKLYDFKNSMAEFWKECNDMLKIGTSFYVLGASLRSAGAFWIRYNYDILNTYAASHQDLEIFSDPNFYQILREMDRGGSYFEVGGFIVGISLVPIFIGIGIEAYKTFKALKRTKDNNF
ncbi:MAG: hypothetical protein QXL86_02485 [Candidatus Aenigmatarchaeota archaeon]